MALQIKNSGGSS